MRRILAVAAVCLCWRPDGLMAQPVRCGMTGEFAIAATLLQPQTGQVDGRLVFHTPVSCPAKEPSTQVGVLLTAAPLVSDARPALTAGDVITLRSNSVTAVTLTLSPNLGARLSIARIH